MKVMIVDLPEKAPAIERLSSHRIEEYSGAVDARRNLSSGAFVLVYVASLESLSLGVSCINLTLEGVLVGVWLLFEGDPAPFTQMTDRWEDMRLKELKDRDLVRLQTFTPRTVWSDLEGLLGNFDGGLKF